jgi:glycosyltransferase involved in cell wall biosynthesis
MKILHLIYSTGIAGAEKYLVNLLPGLQQYDIDCHLICVCPKSSISVFKTYCQLLNSKGIKTTLLSGSKKNFIPIAKAIDNYLKKERITVIHSHLTNADLISVLIKIFYNKKIFVISSKHGYDERYHIKFSANEQVIDKNLYYHYMRFLLKNIDVNLATSKALADLYFNLKLTKKPFHYIYHGIHPMEMITNNEGNSKPQLIIVGRLEKVKGHRYLLEAMKEVLQQLPTTNLLILGEGSEENNLKKQVTETGIENNITFMGFQKEPYKYISQSDIIIQPSSFESFGLVFIEAFALKVPVIAFDVPAANEIIINNETGILTPESDSKILAQKIIFLLQNPQERKRLSNNAYLIYSKHYTAQQMIAKTAAWYKSIGLPNLA